TTPEPPEPEEPPEEAEEEAGDDRGTRSQQTNRAPTPPAPGDGEGEGGAPSDAQIEEAIGDTALVALLTGSESPGGRYGEMSAVDTGASLDKGIANARGKNIKALGGRGAGGHREGGT